MIDFRGQICYSSVFFNNVFELWTNFMFWFGNFGSWVCIRLLAIMMLCFMLGVLYFYVFC